MADLVVKKVNNTHMMIYCEDDIALELSQAFAFFVEGYKHHPLFKQRRWNGKIHFFRMQNRTLPTGMIAEVFKFCEDRKYSLRLDDSIKDSFIDHGYTREDFVKEITQIPISAYGEPIEWRDYQLLGIYDGIKTKRKVFSSNTSSGKSAIQFGLVRLLQDRIGSKILLIVPSTSLVEQMYSDFRDYSSNDDTWYVEDNCARLYSEYDYDNKKQILISTWQSLQNKDHDFFEQFDVVICDEAHQAKAKVISRIMECCVNAEYRFAFTGTVPKDNAARLTIVGHFGPVKVLSTSKDAMDKGYISKLEITGILLNYDEQTVKKVSKMKYQDEVNFLCSLEQRNKYITEMAKKLKGNTLILTARVESHGKILYNILKDNPGTKKVFYIFGEVDTAERERIRSLMEKEDDIVVVGNFQILSTGWSVRNLHNLIFAFPSKSFTRVVQSVGRSLRKHDSKNTAKLFDVADNFGYSIQHFNERLEIYNDERFDVKLIEVSLNESLYKNSILEIG